jgi:hypothetical protein
MVDRLMPVGSQGSRWQAELPVEVDGRGEGEDARGDAADQSVRGSREMALQAELSLSELTIDSMLADSSLGRRTDDDNRGAAQHMVAVGANVSDAICSRCRGCPAGRSRGRLSVSRARASTRNVRTAQELSAPEAV